MSRPDPRKKKRLPRPTPATTQAAVPTQRADNSGSAGQTKHTGCCQDSTGSGCAQTTGPISSLATTAPVRTARNTRQVLTYGTVADIADTLPAPVEGSDLVLDTPILAQTRFPDRTVEQSINFIRHTQIVEFIDPRYAATKAKAGRPALISARAILVAMHLAIRNSRPLLLTEMRDTLYLRLSPSMQRLLDIPHDPRPLKQRDAALWADRTEAHIRRAFHRLLSTIDPSTLPKGRTRTWEQIASMTKDLRLAEQQERTGALDWVCNQLLEAAFQQLPASVRERRLTPHGTGAASKPGYAIDGTPLRLFARGRGIDNPEASVDPDGGYYVREGDHRDPADANPTTRMQRTHTKVMWAREIHLLITADTSHDDRHYLPALPIAFSTDRPGVDPAGAARRVFANMAHRRHQPGWLAGDILYTNQASAQFQTPAREAGYDLVLAYGANQLGRQGTHSSGIAHVEGADYAPCIPDDLVEATTDLRARKITLAQYKQRIQARVEYRMRTKERPKDGALLRLTCPAAGPAPTAICALKPKSQTPRPTKQSDGLVADLRPVIRHTKVLTRSAMPKVCAQESVAVEADHAAKYRQSLPYGSDLHDGVYNRLRQSQEGVHGSAKDEAAVALDNPGRRRVHGWAAQQLFAAFLLAETATRRIITFLRDAIPDEHGHLYVPRLKRTGTHATTHNPPGGPPIGPAPGPGSPGTTTPVAA